MNPASESVLGELHVAVADALKLKIGGSECSAADLNAAIKFLKDNNITATKEANKALGELQEQLSHVTSVNVSDADQKELQTALDNVVAFRGSVANA